MIRELMNSHVAFRILLAVPATLILARYAIAGGGLGQVIGASGEWAVRLLIMTLAVTPLRVLFKGQQWPMWLFKRRRDLGAAAFLYALLHVVAYVVRQSSPAVLLRDVMLIEYAMGWLALAAMLLPFLLSNDLALRWLGTWWKPVQRLAYVAAVAAFLHWLWMKRDDTAALVHFAPLAVLEAYRLWYHFVRPNARRPEE
jgi:sulfoxide reductase heme-binding subunit YedZ